MGKKNAAATPAIAALQAEGVEFRVHEYAHDPRAESFGGEAAQALGHDPARVFKTLVIGDGKQLAVAIVPTSGKLSLKAAGAALRLHRPAMADPADVRRVTGYVLGGVSPLGQRKRLPTAIDESALGFETVFCSAGRRGLEVEVAPSDLVRLTSAAVAPLAAP
ncbi:Cys-tRNA(Pro) deacylase [Tsukamurella paurometabola]|uniref:Cys-tRNA(Pro)/Cys-tRNA(Cys) deacylase n=1 Tax=Tsukamurella paurometabola TaxID=2061 RepID=A0ABS5NCW7_TSUPA|nr:Cys-tRNA(Pro) deacylase [Tsukamurella paurometabola]MBS4102114.1 Cys-tRNA(Pro) deacylase [Tsukamurella paurometabola]